MKTKKHSSSLPSGLGRGRTKPTRRSRWLGLLVTFVLLFGFGQTAKAHIKWNWLEDWNPTSGSPEIAFNSMLMEWEAEWSYWGTKGNVQIHDIYIDGHKLPDMSDLNRSRDDYLAIRNEKWYKVYEGEYGWIAVREFYVQHNTEFWAFFTFIPRYNFIGKGQTVTFSGDYYNNGSNYGVYTTSHTYSNSDIAVPSLGTFGRSNGKIKY